MVTATIPARLNRAPDRQAYPAPGIFARHLAAPSLFSATCFATGILLSHLAWFLPGLLLLALLAAFATAAIASALAPRVAWGTTAIVYMLLGVFCAEIAPPINPQRQLALLADNTQRTVEGEIIRLGPVRSVVSTTPFSDKTHEEHTQQVDVRLNSTGAARITLYAPVEQPFPHLACNNAVRATLASASGRALP